MASPNPIPLIKAFANELDGRGEDQRASLAKSATGNLTCEALFGAKFYQMVRELRKSDRSLSALEAENRVAKDGGLGSRLHDLAFGSFSDFDGDEHMERIMKANPDSLTKLALLIMKEAV